MRHLAGIRMIPPLSAVALLFCFAPEARANLLPSRKLLTEPSPLRIRVRIGEPQKLVQVRGFDLGFSQGTRADRSSEWRLSCAQGRVRAEELEKGRSFESRTALSVETPAGFLHLNGKPYREKLVIVPKGDRCEVVNHLDLEKYLDGLVNAEFSSGWSEEAVAAQVIAARTYAVHQIREAMRKPGSVYDVDSTTRDQVYDGSVREDWRASRSVERTRGVILAVREGAKVAPLKAFYHSTCGGKTELPQSVWGRIFPGFRKRVPCPFCQSSPRFEWTVDLTPRDLVNALLSGSGRLDWPKAWRILLPGARLLEAKVLKSDAEGRVTEVLTRWQSGITPVSLPVSAVELRNWVGVTRLKSTRFRISRLPGGFDGIRVEGRGFGHGVGMCQWGAKVMGERGQKYRSILAHYYPDARLKKLW